MFTIYILIELLAKKYSLIFYCNNAYIVIINQVLTSFLMAEICFDTKNATSATTLNFSDQTNLSLGFLPFSMFTNIFESINIRQAWLKAQQ